MVNRVNDQTWFRDLWRRETVEPIDDLVAILLHGRDLLWWWGLEALFTLNQRPVVDGTIALSWLGGWPVVPVLHNGVWQPSELVLVLGGVHLVGVLEVERDVLQVVLDFCSAGQAGEVLSVDFAGPVSGLVCLQTYNSHAKLSPCQIT